MASPRIPFPVKVLVSYLVVVFAGALPIVVYLSQRFSHELTSFAAHSLVDRSRLVARTLAPLPVDERLKQVAFIARTSLERFTYIDREGFVLYDSEVTDPRKLNNHADRPEVLLARHERAEREPFDPGIWSSGVSRRMSATTEVMTLYAASLIGPVSTVPAGGAAAGSAPASVSAAGAAAPAPGGDGSVGDPAAAGGSAPGGQGAPGGGSAHSAAPDGGAPPVAGSEDRKADVLRLSLPVDEVESLSATLEGVFRNSLAVSVSVAILMALLSALLFLRPLQRVVATANALAEGDYTASPPRMGNDEIGDVGRALKQLGVELRRRLAHAEAGSAMMTQLVETMSVPLALFDPDRVPVAINGPARELLHAVGEAEEDRIEAFVADEGVQAAMARCVKTGRPEKIKVQRGKEAEPVRGWVAALERPERPPFVAFMGQAAYRPAGSRLPKPSSVKVLQLADVIQAGVQRATAQVQGESLTPAEPGEVPKAWVSDAYGRLALAVAFACEESARLAARASSERGTLEYTTDDVAVTVILPTSLGSEAVANLRMLLEPLGGEVKVEGPRAELVLARA